MKIVYAFLFLVFFYAKNLSGQSVDFLDISLQEAFEVAKTESKYVFVYLSLENSILGKNMYAKVFESSYVGVYYNKYFIAKHIDTNHSEYLHLKQHYSIDIFPSMLFLDTDGSVLYKVIGKRRIDEVMRYAQIVVENKKNLKLLESAFERGDRSQETTLALAEAYLEAGDERSEEIAELYLSKEKDWTTEKNIRLNFTYARPSKTSKLFQYMLKNELLFREIIGDYDYEDKVDYAIKFDAYKKGILGEDLESFSKFSKGYYMDENLAQLKAARYNIEKLLNSQDVQNHRLCIKKINQHLATNNTNNFVLYNAVAWEIQLLTEDKEILEKCREWVDKSIQINETYYNTDTKAMIEYKLGNLTSARLFAIRSLQLCIAVGVRQSVIDETRSLLDKIKAKEKLMKSRPRL